LSSWQLKEKKKKEKDNFNRAQNLRISHSTRSFGCPFRHFVKNSSERIKKQILGLLEKKRN
jgi:hypothetical protein